MGHNDLRRSKKYTPRANIKCHLFFILFYIITVSYFKVAKFAIETQKVTVQHPVKGTLIFEQNRENKISVSSLL